MVAKPSIWSVRWRIYTCPFVSDFTVISLISKLLMLLYCEACLWGLIQAVCLGLAMPPVQLTARPLQKRQSLMLLIFFFCSTLAMLEFFAVKGNSNSWHLPFHFTRKALEFCSLSMAVTGVEGDSFPSFLLGWLGERVWDSNMEQEVELGGGDGKGSYV